MQHIDLSDFILLPPGRTAICRQPLEEVPTGTRLATAAELFAANLGYPFPWGRLPHDGNASILWKRHHMGMGGLIHEKWFATSDGRFGGALNVPTQLPGSLRHCLLYDGGACGNPLEENEGYAVVIAIAAENADMYRKVQMHAAEHVGADGGAIIVSPICGDGVARVGFVGRCQICPNPELVSFKQLQAAVSEFHFELWPEWKDWSLVA